ncbi:putative mitochondrial chaperone bcs1 [Colletotrichum sublineola]|uniref:Putative mitochondrial chaperone bcs1 n=1 Tax=Colletotrichum sublineola TaxID=1173701 RepID=A0A066Y275_COLSU|nr:putative mitochondrial chaperone bcs1 [Colletotrichum sublineola]
MDIFFPGFTGVTTALHQLLNGNLDSYAGLLCICGLVMVCGKFLTRTIGGFVDTYFTSKTDVHDPDEAYDMLECWISAQSFAKNACSSLISVDSRRGRALVHPSGDTTAKKPLRFTPWRERQSFCLSMSITGCFGLDIYVLSLAGINDGRLSALFAELPQRCVVLLEDVDAVGTTQSRDADANESDLGSEVSRGSSKPPGTLSLSGLLNVLDGVASQEGCVLIMTTNHIEHLDDALIRPGRVDKKIKFQLADAEVAKKLFCTVFE